MILLTRLNGTQVGINADLIERVEATGDTVVSLIDGTRYVVSESCADVVDRVVEFRARVLIAADAGLDDLYAEPGAPGGAGAHRDHTRSSGPLRLVVESDDETSGPAAGTERGGR